MRTCLYVLVSALVLAIGIPQAGAITWGWDDGDDHPHVGAIIIDFRDLGRDDYEYAEYCSGTLIHPEVFLTAAHCTVDLEDAGFPDEHPMWVSFDPDPVNHPRTWLEVSEIITHPDYYWGPTSNPIDIAVLILARPAKKIAPAVLPELGLLDALEPDLREGSEVEPFLAVGYGGVLSFPPPDITYPDTRRYAWMGYQTLLRAWLVTSQNQSRGDGGTCYGDSGGPVFYVDDYGNETLVAVTSWGDVPCVAIGFYYRVDIPDTLDFLADVLSRVNARR